MALALNNIKALADSLRAQDWYITAFAMNDFDGHNYAVVFEDLRALNKGTRYYGVELTFIDMADVKRILVVRANAYGFSHKEKALAFFGVNGNKKGKYPEYCIYNALNNACPSAFTEHPTTMRTYIMNAVNIRDKENGSGFCCFKARRNGKKSDGTQMHRTPFNTAKTRLLRKTLFEKMGQKDDSISFCYRDTNELSDAEIIYNFQRP
jgi:hypothetical protein